jgi:hypothetical protein
LKIKKSFFLCCLIYIASYTCFSATERDNNKYINHPGKNIYLHGPGKNSTPDNSFSTSKENNKIACANCHRRSGYGTSEGGMLVPPITGNILFNEREFKYKQLRPQKSRPITRSAYTDESLKRAIRDGIDANGRPLDLLMPRYNLSEPELNKLVRYLKSLGKEKVDGVDESTIHMATIISPYSSKSNIQSHVDQSVKVTHPGINNGNIHLTECGNFISGNLMAIPKHGMNN